MKRRLTNTGLPGIKRILDDPDILHITRRSVTGGVSAGLFIAFLPMPGHTLLGIITAIWFRFNLPLLILFTWATNPLTVAPVYYLSYKLGAVILNKPLRQVEFEMSWSGFSGLFLDIWPSLLTGCMLMSVVTAGVSYLLIQAIWRLSVMNKWNRRQTGKLK